MSKKNFKIGFDSLLGEASSPKTETREKGHAPSQGTRATFIVDHAQLQNLKAIAYWERKKIKTILAHALEKYIEHYVKKHGEIPPLPDENVE